MSVEAETYNRWKITIGLAFEANLRHTDKTLDKIENPNFDSSCPVSPSNPRTINAPKDLTGYGAIMDIRETAANDSTLLKTLSTTGGGITIGSPDPADGTIKLFIDNLDTADPSIADFARRDVHYCLVLIPPAGEAFAILEGTIYIAECPTDISGV